MVWVLMILGVPLGALGAYLIGVFLWMLFKDGVEVLDIVGFQELKDKRRLLPIVEYVDEGEEGQVAIPGRVDVKSIWSISYLLSPPIEREEIEVAGVRGGNPRVFGYLGLVMGVLMLVPGLVALGMRAEQSYFLGQMVFILILMGALLGGWVVLKVIQRM